MKNLNLMKITLTIMLILSLSSLADANEMDVASLLKRDLGDAIEVYSDKEVWYCPDNTCEIYSSIKAHPDFPGYVYLHLYHQSGYKYLDLSFGDVKAFRITAVEEPEVRKNLINYCPSSTPDPDCILSGMQKELDVSVCFGRYDEDGFWGCDKFREKALKR